MSTTIPPKPKNGDAWIAWGDAMDAAVRELQPLLAPAGSGLARAADTTIAWDGTNGGAADSLGRQRINTAQWSYDLGGGETPIGSGDRFGNWEQQVYTSSPDNVWVKGGSLHIRARKANTPSPVAGEVTANFSSGRIHTGPPLGGGASKLTVPVGAYVEARIRMPVCPGTWPAFWAMGANYVKNADNTANWPYCGEIDTVEAFGQEPHSAGFALHMPAAGTPNDINAWQHNLYVGWDNFDTVYRDPALDIAQPNFYGFWNSGTEIRRYVNRRETFRYTQAQATASGRYWPFNQPMFLLINLAIGGQAGGTDYVGGLMPEMVVDPIGVWTGVADPTTLGLGS